MAVSLSKAMFGNIFRNFVPCVKIGFFCIISIKSLEKKIPTLDRQKSSHYLCEQFGPRSGETRRWVLLLSIVLHSGGISDFFFFFENINLKKKKISRQQKNMQNYSACKELKNEIKKIACTK